MNFEELRRITELLKLLKALKGQQEIVQWIEENKEVLRSLSPEELEDLREKADYDEEAWQEILKQLLPSDD